MGLPEINIEFKGKAVSALARSAMGIVALVLKDDTGQFDLKEYKKVEDVESTDWTPANIDYIKKAFLGKPQKVICVKQGADTLKKGTPSLDATLKLLGSKKWNYLAIPGLSEADKKVVSNWITTKRDTDKKTFKAVLSNEDADHEGIINFSTEGIKVGGKVYSAAEYCVRIAGILAGLPFTRSSTYYVLDEVESITETETPNEDIDAGKLILINDEEKIKIGRGVNSLVTTTLVKTEDFKKIKILEVMDMITDDIRGTFKNNYVGQVNNIYDNQVLFFTSINDYFKTLTKDEVLDINFINQAFLNVESQRAAWEKIGVDTTDWDEQKVKAMSFKSNVFVSGNIKIVDAMEDLDFQIAI